MGESLKSKLRKLVVPVAAFLTLGACGLYIFHGEEFFNGNKRWHHYQKIEGLFTKKVFTSSVDNFGRGQETFCKYNPFKGGVVYRDVNLDGEVDEITGFSRFKKSRIDLTKSENYDSNKPEFDEANERFAEIRKPYIARMEKLLADQSS